MIYKATVAYDGSHYAGWQKQINALGIQEVIESVLTKIHKKDTDIVASGRTDAKVHATGQVFHFEANEKIEACRYVDAMNALLPKDIRILDIQKGADDFHARFSAISKQYEYICTYDTKNPFIYSYKEVLLKQYDVDAMRKASNIFLGTHDFTSFSSSHIDARKPRVKTINEIQIIEDGQDIRFVFEGTGFLRYQVRMMVGTLLAVGCHMINENDVKIMLEAKDKHACRYNASPQGLYLRHVYYGDES